MLHCCRRKAAKREEEKQRKKKSLEVKVKEKPALEFEYDDDNPLGTAVFQHSLDLSTV